MNILIDGMGGDNAPKEIIAGAILATKEIKDQLIIIGQEDLIKKTLQEQGYKGKQIQVVNADDFITNEEAPVKAVRTKQESSIVKGLNMVKEGKADVFLSAGSTGALLAGGLFILGRIQGIDRPALATIYPVIGSEPALLVDCGANTECKPNNLLEFATMGSIYMDKVIGRKNPKVGLVNNGTEEGKGTTLTKAAFELLTKSHLNFVGNVEAREVPRGACDVIVTDGFTGNVIVKLSEGLGLTMLKTLKKKFTEGTAAKMGAVLLKNKLTGIKKELDYTEYGGAPILGVKGGILKMHGSSDALAVKQTILKAVPYVKENVVDTIQNSVLEIEEILISE